MDWLDLPGSSVVSHKGGPQATTSSMTSICPNRKYGYGLSFEEIPLMDGKKNAFKQNLMQIIVNMRAESHLISH